MIKGICTPSILHELNTQEFEKIMKYICDYIHMHKPKPSASRFLSFDLRILSFLEKYGSLWDFLPGWRYVMTMTSCVMLSPRNLKLLACWRAKPRCADLHFHYQFNHTELLKMESLRTKPSSKRAEVTSL